MESCITLAVLETILAVTDKSETRFKSRESFQLYGFEMAISFETEWPALLWC